MFQTSIVDAEKNWDGSLRERGYSHGFNQSQICVYKDSFRMERSGGPQPNSRTLSPIVRRSHILVLRMWYWVGNITQDFVKKVWPDNDLKETDKFRMWNSL